MTKLRAVNKFNLIAVVFLVFINFLGYIQPILNGFFAFAYDQGRDLLAVAKIIYEGNLTLIGPTTGLQGIFYGPWWYYFLVPFLYISDGNPQGVAIFFGFLGLFTVIAIFLLTLRLTNNLLISFLLTLTASMSKNWMLVPTLIWSPSLVPILMVGLVLTVFKIFNSQKPIYFFAFGLIVMLIADSGAAFGIMLTLSFLLTPLIFRKAFLKKEFLISILGAMLILLPKIIFELRNNFLISRSIISYIENPKIYGGNFSFFTRVWHRIDQVWGLISASISNSNKLLGLLAIILIVLVLFKVCKDQKSWEKLKSDKLFWYLNFVLVTIFVGFTIYKDTVWDYYLVGLPVIFIILIAKIFNLAHSIKNLKVPVITFLFFLVALNFDKSFFTPFKITWPGEGATYRNEKMVMDYIASQNPKDYSFFAYSPAIFDPPFDYLLYWYSRKGLIESPKTNQKNMYLVIREAETKKYLVSGWYGDKTKDSTVILDRREFPGLLVEKHQFD